MSRFSVFGKSKSKDLSAPSGPSENSLPTEPTPGEFAAAAEASARRKLERGVITDAEYQEIIAMNARLQDERVKDIADDAALAQQKADDESRLKATTEAAAGAYENAKTMLEQGNISQAEFDEIVAQNTSLHSSTAPVEAVLNAFTCPECMAGFADQDSLMLHFSTKHG